nr:hypothetical protein [Mycoplasmopsis bovis]
MKRSITKIPLLGKLVLKTGIFITPPLLISASCYSPNKINKNNVLAWYKEQRFFAIKRCYNTQYRKTR